MKPFSGYQVRRRKLREERERLRRERKKLRRNWELLRRERERHREQLGDLRAERRQLQAERQYPLRTQIAHYRIEGLLSSAGATARVYRARDVRDGRAVAIKMARLELSQVERFRVRWHHESNMAASIDHPHLMKIVAGEVDGQKYIAMPLAQGGDLWGVVAQEGGLSPERTLQILGPVAAAVDAVHARGLIHGDVSMRNILLDADYSAYLADSAPRGSDPRVDIDAFARVLYACLGGPGGIAHFQREGKKMDRFPSLGNVLREVPARVQQAIAKTLVVAIAGGYPTCTSLVSAVRAELYGERSPLGLVPEQERDQPPDLELV